jgi:hypothetical protein
MNVRPFTILIALMLSAIPVTASAGPAGLNMCLNILKRSGRDDSTARLVCTCAVDDLSRDYSDEQQDMLFRGLYFGSWVDGDAAFEKRFSDLRAKCGEWAPR